jgi:hypothetical protein
VQLALYGQLKLEAAAQQGLAAALVMPAKALEEHPAPLAQTVLLAG